MSRAFFACHAMCACGDSAMRRLEGERPREPRFFACQAPCAGDDSAMRHLEGERIRGPRLWRCLHSATSHAIVVRLAGTLVLQTTS